MYMSLVILWRQGAKLEIESVLRETCDRVLADPGIPARTAQLRATALQIMGEALLHDDLYLFRVARTDNDAGLLGGVGSGVSLAPGVVVRRGGKGIRDA